MAIGSCPHATWTTQTRFEGEIPIHSSPLQSLIQAGLNCDAFRRNRIQVAKPERVFLADHMAVATLCTDCCSQEHLWAHVATQKITEQVAT